MARLQQIPAVIAEIPAGTVVARIFFGRGTRATTWDSFRFFGPTASRFDHHLLDDNGKPYEQTRGIMYVAADRECIPTCIAEVFQVGRVVDRHRRQPILAGFELAAGVGLLDLRGPFATAIGASMAIHSGPRPRARRWARALYLAYPEADGIFYCSSMYGHAPVIALFERGRDTIPERPCFHRSLDDPALENVVVETARKVGYAVV